MRFERALSIADLAEAARRRLPVSIHGNVSGGMRRGTDVLKALALGARCVFVGRPAMYGLAVGGEAGAAHALHLPRREIDVDLALLGGPDVALLNPDYLTAAAAALH